MNPRAVPRHNWTHQQQTRAIHLRERGWSSVQVSEDLGIPETTIRTWTQGIGIPLGVTHAYVAKVQRIVDLYLAGETLDAIAVDVGLRQHGVVSVLQVCRRRWHTFPRRSTSGGWVAEPQQGYVVQAVDLVNYRRRRTAGCPARMEIAA